MNFRHVFKTTGLLLALLAYETAAARRAAAQAVAEAPPILRLEAGGPTSYVSALAFNPQGNVLYAGGWDKVVRVWTWDAVGNRFVLDQAATYRFPIGPAMAGVINAVAVSPDGALLAAAGEGVIRGATDFWHTGWKVPTAGVMSAEMQKDEGTIYLFNTRTHEARALRGHGGAVVNLAFAPGAEGQTPILISAGRQRGQGQDQFAGAVFAWDAERGVELGHTALPELVSRPSIAVVRRADDAKRVGVAIAWGDAAKQLRIWDVDSGAVSTADDGSYNDSAIWWAEGKRLITGSSGRVRLWTIDPAGKAVFEREVELPLVERGANAPKSMEVPRALALFASQDQGRVDRLAMLVKADEALKLRVFDLSEMRLLTDRTLSLGESRGIAPVLAANAGGRHLAFAGWRTHEIATCDADDLLAGNVEPSRLGARGVSARRVAFVTKEGVQGILVGTTSKSAAGARPAAPVAGDLIFDPVSRRVTDQIEGWKVSAPASGAWSMQIEREPRQDRREHHRVTLLNGRTAAGSFWLPLNRKVTDYALLPPRAPLNVPLVAIATTELGRPSLEIYHGASGALVRELSGHVAAVESLALSEDGALLVSTAGDRTVCVWNLADLNQTLGLRGAAPGITLVQRDKVLVVTEVAADGPYRSGPLAKDDVITSWADGTPVESLTDFYLGISRLRPGQNAALKRTRGRNAAETVNLVVQQGVDERKPLASLFIAEGTPWNWIGWSPLGPYDSSSGPIENWLGWHFNTGQTARPARFAAAGEYQSLRREGLIAYLMRNRQLPVDKPPALERPAMMPRLRQAGEQFVAFDGQNPLRLLETEATLELELAGLPANRIREATWRLDEGDPQPLAPVSLQVWTADLSDVSTRRAVQKLILEVTTNEAEPQTFREVIPLVYHPLPTLEVIEPVRESVVSGETMFRLRSLAASPDDPRESLNITVHQIAGGQTVFAQGFCVDSPSELDLLLKLEPGENVIHVTAANSASGADESEQREFVRTVTYNPRMIPPPRIAVQAISPGVEPRRLISDQTQPLVVDSAKLRLAGSIESEAPLSSVQGWLADRELPIESKPQSAQRLAIEETVELEPGLQTLRVRAETEGGTPAEVSLSVDYRPRLPEAILLLSPKDKQGLIAGRDARGITLQGRLTGTADTRPFEARLHLNGVEQPARVQIDAKGENFSIPLELADGENRIQVILQNAWQSRRASNEVRVSYLRPPRIVNMTVADRVTTPLVKIAFTVETAAKLPLTGLQVNGWTLPVEKAIAEPKGDVTLWRVVAEDIPLRQGDNEIRPLARNAEGWSVDAPSRKVSLTLPPPPKPVIELVQPASDTSANSPTLELAVRVRSQGRLKNVEIRADGQPPRPINVQRQTPVGRPSNNGAALYQLDVKDTIRLHPEENRLRIVAKNDGGETAQVLNVVYVRKPVTIHIDGLEPMDSSGPVLNAGLREGANVQFDSIAPAGSMMLHGHVHWETADDIRQNEVKFVKVWVNGFLQRPIKQEDNLKSLRGLDWHWKVPICLSRDRDNEISVQLPQAVKSINSQLNFKIDCQAPNKRQRLHLLVIGEGDEDIRQLEDLAIRAVNGQRGVNDKDQIVTEAFSAGRIYLLDDHPSTGNLIAQLQRISKELVSANEQSGSDLVVIYFRGKETVDVKGQFYLMMADSMLVEGRPPIAALSGDYLAERFDSIPGAQLLLLDVHRDQPAQEVSFRWPRDPQMAVMRYIWLSSQQVPDEDRLLSVLQPQSVPGTTPTRLGDVAQAASRQSKSARERYKQGFEYEERIPSVLLDVVLRTP